MDVTQTLRYKVLVERKNYAFFVDLDYENIPEFCNHYRKIGHNIDYCKFLRIPEVKEGAEGRKKNAQAPTKDTWQKKNEMKKQGNEVTDPIDVDLLKADAENVKNLNNGKKPEVNNVSTIGVKNNTDMAQKNSFDALINVDANQENISAAMRAEDRALEKENNFELEVGNTDDEDTDASSHGFEFVDATQQNFRTEEFETNPQLIHEDIVVPNEHGTDGASDVDLERGHIEFLQQSWTWTRMR